MAIIPTIVWDNPNNITYGTALSNIQLNATTGVPGTFVYDPVVGVVLNAGAHQALNVTFTPTDTDTYTSSSKTVYINVQKNHSNVTWTPPTNIHINTILGSGQLNAHAHGGIFGTYTYVPDVGTVLSTPGEVTLNVTFTPID